MDNIFRVADERQIKALSLSVSDLCNWIREVIKANGLKAIVFIWDEFTEYFYNNARNLTGFQELCEISETDPFYFILVTHVTQGLFHERDQDFIKLNGRFVSPHSLISLPENIAFKLMGAALEKNEDEAVKADWEQLSMIWLTGRRNHALIKSVARISDQEMIDILPIHPYAALLLNISLLHLIQISVVCLTLSKMTEEMRLRVSSGLSIIMDLWITIRSSPSICFGSFSTTREKNT